jgi:ubiquinone/menaquinone biosynthesis C-methylase UbiE
MMQSQDLNRLRHEYAARAHRVNPDQYSMFNAGNLFLTQQRQRDTVDLLSRSGLTHLADQTVLEVGAGAGGVLLEYLLYGATAKNVHGIDLLMDRLQAGRRRLPNVRLVCADGQALPYRNGSFDLVLQYTALSSVLDPDIKARMADEMVRVLHPSRGLIVWYDFWLNPTNKQTRGIGLKELKHLFPGADYDYRKVTLAPPLARSFAGQSRIACELLERLRLLNTHYLAIICPRANALRL